MDTSSGHSLPDAQKVPILKWDGSSGKKYIVCCLDLDAPFPSFAALSPTLHWLQTGFAPDIQSGDLTSPDPAIAAHGGPGSPPMSGQKRDLFFLYEQPIDLDINHFVKANGFRIRDRMRWNYSNFEKEANLGEIIAATYFLSN